MIKEISLNEFLINEPCFKNCFRCANKNYNEFYFNDHFYRVCDSCLRNSKVKIFFRSSCRIESSSYVSDSN